MEEREVIAKKIRQSKRNLETDDPLHRHDLQKHIRRMKQDWRIIVPKLGSRFQWIPVDSSRFQLALYDMLHSARKDIVMNCRCAGHLPFRNHQRYIIAFG